MFTQIISHITMVISMAISSSQPSHIEIVEAPNIREQVLTLDENDLNSSIQLFEEMKSNSCSKNGCSLASHK